jgi:hypothetical protein
MSNFFFQNVSNFVIWKAMTKRAQPVVGRAAVSLNIDAIKATEVASPTIRAYITAASTPSTTASKRPVVAIPQERPQVFIDPSLLQPRWMQLTQSQAYAFQTKTARPEASTKAQRKYLDTSCLKSRSVG